MPGVAVDVRAMAWTSDTAGLEKEEQSQGAEPHLKCHDECHTDSIVALRGQREALREEILEILTELRQCNRSVAR